MWCAVSAQAQCDASFQNIYFLVDIIMRVRVMSRSLGAWNTRALYLSLSLFTFYFFFIIFLITKNFILQESILEKD